MQAALGNGWRADEGNSSSSDYTGQTLVAALCGAMSHQHPNVSHRELLRILIHILIHIFIHAFNLIQMLLHVNESPVPQCLLMRIASDGSSSTLSSISATFQQHRDALSKGQSSHSSNVFLSTDIPISTTPSNYDIVDAASKRIPGNDPTATAHANIMNDDVNENTAAHLSMQSHIQNLESPKSIKYLIEVSFVLLL